MIDGRNVWAADLDLRARPARRARRPRSAASASRSRRRARCCTCPYAAARETAIDAEIRRWLAFGAEKLDELRAARRAVDATPATATRCSSRRARRSRARARTSRADQRPGGPRAGRRALRARRLRPRRAATRAPRARSASGSPLPELPTTTIGSFPQTAEIRARAPRPRRRLDDADYERFMQAQIAEVDRRPGAARPRRARARRAGAQRHGRVLRRAARGFAFSEHGWVQSYGSRCVKPPILYGDVSRPAPMTVRWWQHAQSLTEKPVKGMLDRPGDDPAVVVRARRPAAPRDLHADRARDPGRGRRPRGRRLRRDPGRRGRAARGPAAAPGRAGRLRALGGRLLPADGRAGARRTPRSTPTCATRSSTR